MKNAAHKTVRGKGDATAPLLVNPPPHLVSISVQGNFLGAITLQRAFGRPIGWETVDIYSSATARNMEVAEKQWIRLICTVYHRGMPKLRIGHAGNGQNGSREIRKERDG